MAEPTVGKLKALAGFMDSVEGSADMVSSQDDPSARSHGPVGWAERRQNKMVLAACAGAHRDRGQAAGAAKANRHIPASLSHGTWTRCHHCHDSCRHAGCSAGLLAHLSCCRSSPERRQEGSVGYEEVFMLE